jgi:hypothetical protein
MKRKHTMTWDDLTDEARAKVENTEKGVRLINEGIAILLSRPHLVTEEERAGLHEGRRAASGIADRHAALVLQSLRAVTEVEDV